MNTQKVTLDSSSSSQAIVDDLTSAQATARLQSTIEEQAQIIARLQSTIEEQADANLSLKVGNTRLESAKEELEGDVEYYKEKYSNAIKKMDKANETYERQKLENENLKRQLRGMNTSSSLIDLSLPCSSSVPSASPSGNRKRGIGEIDYL
jgi:predicted nuclease with TOPRIM domain